MNRRVVAIDGPGGSGKSTVSRAVAERLTWAHLDTGAFYRAATMAVLRAGVDPGKEAAVLSEVLDHAFVQSDGRMFLDGEDVSAEIRSEDVTAAVSDVSAHPLVRARLVELQRAWVDAQPNGAVVEGRDIGTVVFPDASVKVFLTADPEERARRRAGETGSEADSVARALERRDAIDRTRTASPLQAADDAVVIDTTYMNVDEVVETVLACLAQAGPPGWG